MEFNKKKFIEVMRKITRENDLKKFNIIIWHGDTVEYRDALYIELMFTVNDDEIYYKVNADYDLYYGEDLEDTEDNLKVIYKSANAFKRKLKTWIVGTWLNDIEIIIKEENI